MTRQGGRMRCRRLLIELAVLGACCWPSQAQGAEKRHLANFTSNLETRVKQVEDGLVQNGFCWGRGLGPSGDFRSMFGKVAGCLLHKAEVIAMQWDVSSGNATGAVDAPAQFYRTLCNDMAACCAFTSKRSWCLGVASPAYTLLATMAEAADKDVENSMDQSDNLADTFAILTKAAAQLLEEIKEGYSERSGMLMSACNGASSCSAADLDRLRRALQPSS
eukprot:TRINITY_DN92864_c0_g1_i1.p1 TRINITY_DN92864_c0_g1~~TRINITY_DN92864_c0_g1_i1.p1  ORF type:complete len:220 (-),score=54.13 TRINITY_DN92864_c0_g1_i1:50-709(-)